MFPPSHSGKGVRSTEASGTHKVTNTQYAVKMNLKKRMLSSRVGLEVFYKWELYNEGSRRQPCGFLLGLRALLWRRDPSLYWYVWKRIALPVQDDIVRLCKFQFNKALLACKHSFYTNKHCHPEWSARALKICHPRAEWGIFAWSVDGISIGSSYSSVVFIGLLLSAILKVKIPHWPEPYNGWLVDPFGMTVFSIWIKFTE